VQLRLRRLPHRCAHDLNERQKHHEQANNLLLHLVAQHGGRQPLLQVAKVVEHDDAAQVCEGEEGIDDAQLRQERRHDGNDVNRGHERHHVVDAGARLPQRELHRVAHDEEGVEEARRHDGARDLVAALVCADVVLDELEERQQQVYQLRKAAVASPVGPYGVQKHGPPRHVLRALPHMPHVCDLLHALLARLQTLAFAQ